MTGLVGRDRLEGEARALIKSINPALPRRRIHFEEKLLSSPTTGRPAVGLYLRDTDTIYISWRSDDVVTTAAHEALHSIFRYLNEHECRQLWQDLEPTPAYIAALDAGEIPPENRTEERVVYASEAWLVGLSKGRTPESVASAAALKILEAILYGEITQRGRRPERAWLLLIFITWTTCSVIFLLMLCGLLP